MDNYPGNDCGTPPWVVYPDASVARYYCYVCVVRTPPTVTIFIDLSPNIVFGFYYPILQLVPKHDSSTNCRVMCVNNALVFSVIKRTECVIRRKISYTRSPRVAQVISTFPPPDPPERKPIDQRQLQHTLRKMSLA